MHYKSRYPPLPPTPAVNIHDYVFNAAPQQDPADKVQFIEPLAGRRWYKNEVRERIFDCATALVAPETEGGLGFAPEGEMVAVMSTNCVEYIVLIHALFKDAIPVALIPSGATAFELEHLFRTSAATRLFVHAALLPQALQVATKNGIPEDKIYILEGHAQGRRTLASAINEVRKRSIPRVPTKAVKQDTLAYLVFSSGTSGLPKAVMLSHGNVVTCLIQVTAAMMFEGPNPLFENVQLVALGFLPIYHSYGLHFVAIRPIFIAMTSVVIPRWNADLVLDLIPKLGISIMPLTPPAILQLLNHKRIREVDLSSLLSIGSGAAHLPPKVSKAFTALLKNVDSVLEGFGMSECTISATRGAPKQFGGPKLGSAGVLLPGVEARIVRDDGSLAGPNEPGELWVRGSNVALGYWGNEKATRETFADGWLRTGDRFRVDEDEHFFFEERAKDVLKVSGQQVSPTEIENVLLAYPDKLVSDVTVAGVSGGRTSDEKVPRAWIVLSEEGRRRGEVVVAEALNGWIQKNLSKFKWLRGGIEVVDEIPKNPTGKVLRRVLQERYENSIKPKL